MTRFNTPALALALAGTLALAACGEAGVHTADDRVDTPATTAAAEPILDENTPRLQDDALDRSDRDVRTMGDVNDPYRADDRVRDGAVDREYMENDPLEDTGEEIEQEINEADRDLQR
ncbi:hypothetical protein LY625_10465 [Lysobacter sp. GX 14042]|uniref:hypothetical protein n=1 Tax=Lysobacter sp. GX 14042 TaxID=2907155 RepID=UPI001F419511|nr:hypothetical protein [Lysobacter sp. GX 14042]MCE7033030.1 hypothetical protein [Lysobacter sp. GX 14042]